MKKEKQITSPEVLLSILILSTDDRLEFLERLIKKLEPQLNEFTEVLCDMGDGNIGFKRNKLVQKAVGRYVAFIDDDDLVSEDYIEQILKAIRMNPDCCELNGIYYIDGVEQKPFKHSIFHGVDHTGNPYFEDGGAYYRCPNHLNAIKREIAIKYPFPELNHGEDTNFAIQLFKDKALRTEGKIDKIIYHYYYRSNK
jgi:glycosyltransferase involved in cell wall biosynthesis